jgi:hypothetical protein
MTLIKESKGTGSPKSSQTKEGMELKKKIGAPFLIPFRKIMRADMDIPIQKKRGIEIDRTDTSVASR